MAYDPSEQDVILAVFVELLRDATRDGGRKRAAGLKPPWDEDETHLEHAVNHIRAYSEGRLVDPDSHSHPLVHAAWRLLARAYQEEQGICEGPEPSFPTLRLVP